MRVPFFVLLALPVLVPGPAHAEDALERRRLRTVHPIVEAPVTIGDDSARWLVVVTSPDGRRTGLEVFSPGEDGVPTGPSQPLAVREPVVAIDVASIDGGKREALFLLTPASVLRWTGREEQPQRVRDIGSIFRAAPAGRIVALDFMRNATETSEPILLLADFDRLRAGDSELPVAPVTTHVDGGVHYAPAEVHLRDATLDGAPDLLRVVEDEIQVFPGTLGGFGARGSVRPLGLRLSAELSPDQLSDVDQSDVQTRRVVAVEDFDGDDVFDLLIEDTRRSGLLDRQTAHELHLGRRGDAGVTFAPRPDTVIRGDAPLGGIRTVDIDGDGQLDMAAGSIDVGLGTIVSALLTGTVDFDVHFYRMQDGSYPEEPNATREARIEFDLSEARASIPVLLLADVDGDGDRDLVMREDQNELLIFPSQAGPALFGDTPLRMTVPLPENGQLVQAADLNGDAAEDLVVRYEGRSGPDAKRNLTLLLGRSAAVGSD